jgi:TonB-linked SusC/RagA family outer membrane protein
MDCHKWIRTIIWTALVGLLTTTAHAKYSVLYTYQQQNSPEHTVQGTVTDAETGEPLPAVNISVKGTATGTSTDADGQYSLTTSSPQDTLVFSFIGYGRQEIVINNRATIDVTMAPETILGEDVVVTGYSTQRKVDLTGAIESVDLENIETGTSGNVMQSLQGRIPGLYVEKTGTPTGSNSRILIRGISTLGNNDPLYIIDGVPTKRPEVFQSINPSALQSVQVLKDAASASIYGSRASNGVIIATTKDGSSSDGEVNVQFNVSSSIQSEKPQRVDMLGSVDRGRALWQASVNDGVDPAAGFGEIYNFDWNDDFENPQLNNVLLNEFVGGDQQVPAGNTDWQEEIYEPGQVSNFDLTVSGGNENSSLVMNLGYIKNSGMLKYTNYSRVNGRLNATTTQFDERVTFGINTMASASQFRLESTDLGGTETPFLGITLAPTIPVRTTDGRFAGPLGSGYSDRNNPLHMQFLNRWDNTDQNFVFGNAYVDAEILENLNVRTSVGIDYSTYEFKDIDQSFTEGFIARSLNGLTKTTNNFVSVNWSNTLNYTASFGEHGLEVLAGVEAIQTNFDDLIASAQDFAVQSEDFFVIDAASGTKNSLGGSTRSRLLSQFGKINYSFNERYLASVTLRRDGSSRFGQDNKYGFFPSVSVGWRIINEAFLQDVDLFSNLKLRAGFGRVGNQDIGDFASFGLLEARYGPLAANIDGVGHVDFFDQYFNVGTAYDLSGADTGNLPSGFVSTQAGNPGLKWETTDELNIGLDFGFLEERIVGTLDYFFKESSDILIRPPVASAVGEGQEQFLNGATIENTGWEFSLGYNGNRGKDFTYAVSANLSRFQDEISRLPEEVRTAYPGNAVKTILGESQLSIFGYRTEGIFQSQEEVDAHADQVGAAPGRIRYVDLDGNGAINSLDQEFLGTTLPDLEYSIQLTMGYKNFDLSLFGSGVAGRTGFDEYTFYNDFIRGRENVGPGVFDAWTPDNRNSSIPALTLSDTNNETRTSDYLQVNTSYFKLRNLQVGYTLPASATGVFGGLDRVRIYMRGENLFWFKSSEFEGADPERTSFNNIPIPTTYTIGINVSL